VVDDYKTGKFLENYLDNFSQTNEIKIVTRAEDKFIEAKAASLISKYLRESILHQINQPSEYKINNKSIGLGNVGNPATLDWLNRWKKARKPWPWFIKKSFKTVHDLENKTKKVKKIKPSLRDDLLPKEFIQSFEKEKRYIHLLTLKCPSCNKLQRSVNFNLTDWVCPNCATPFENISLTLRYYCSDILPDRETIDKKVILKDFDNRQFFENFKLYINRDLIEKDGHSSLTDENLLELNSSGRLKLEYYDGPSNNQKMVRLAKRYNAVLLYSSKELYKIARDNNIFSIFFSELSK
jgi:hypothetical protein